jgi:uncharacterized protein (TIGR03437 family)
MKVKRTLALLALSASAAFGQTPVVTEILNNYSLINPGSVAQGAIFIVKGSNLSDQTTGLQDAPLRTTLQGVQMAISVGGTTTFAPMYYVLPQQLAGILPSNTPVGAGTLTVRNNGKNSLPVAIDVVRSAFGVLTASGAGTGSARVQDASQGYQELSSTRATVPGNVLVFYGSGVGPVTGDETIQQVQADLTGIPISVTIGGKPAQVFYRGRTVFPGLDQINVQVPALDASTYGCNVVVLITTNSVAANATTIPVAQSGTACPTTPVTGGGPVSGATQQEIDRWIAAGSYTSGSISLGRNTLYSVADGIPGVNSGTTITKSDTFTADFQRISRPDLAAYLRGGSGLPALGSCAITTAASSLLSVGVFEALDAGAAITASGPGGTQVATRSGPGYRALVPNNFVNAGRFTFAGTGGVNVGAFTGVLDVLGDFAVLNPDDLKTITRGAGVTARWTGGDPTVPVQISGISVPINADGSQGAAVSFVCMANSLDGRFTVPSSILTQLPATGSINGAGFGLLVRGSFSVTNAGKGSRITASGIDYFSANNAWTSTVTAEYR